jgi:hypothetical protein
MSTLADVLYAAGLLIVVFIIYWWWIHHHKQNVKKTLKKAAAALTPTLTPAEIAINARCTAQAARVLKRVVGYFNKDAKGKAAEKQFVAAADAAADVACSGKLPSDLIAIATDGRTSPADARKAITAAIPLINARAPAVKHAVSLFTAISPVEVAAAFNNYRAATGAATGVNMHFELENYNIFLKPSELPATLKMLNGASQVVQSYLPIATSYADWALKVGSAAGPKTAKDGPKIVDNAVKAA